ncbi:hypothetical protein KKG83_02235 [Candidatus Micrarchaeota archaeon]|nr:hypothetical protein [Candidatus Micrarchaeota archaeon]MBU2476269.1 hypothetical protein [Candidatus Micrarchaeota archaeon]
MQKFIPLVLFFVLIVFFFGCSQGNRNDLNSNDTNGLDTNSDQNNFQTDCNKLEQEIKEELNSVNYCEEDVDCVVWQQASCPFGCYNFVNKNADLNPLKEKIVQYNEECELCLYECTPFEEKLSCENNKCVQVLSDVINANLDDLFKLKKGQTAVIGEKDIEITFLDVLEDSRCPEDVVCVWEGQVKVELSVSEKENEPESFILTKKRDFDELGVKHFGGFTVELVKVVPYPNTTIEKGDYIITLIAIAK